MIALVLGARDRHPEQALAGLRFRHHPGTVQLAPSPLVTTCLFSHNAGSRDRWHEVAICGRRRTYRETVYLRDHRAGRAEADCPDCLDAVRLDIPRRSI